MCPFVDTTTNLKMSKMMSQLALICFICFIVVSATNPAGKAFLEENAKKPNVIVLASGLQYKVLKNGDGQFHPKADSSCDCHYAGTLIDGTEFDSSYKRGSPTAFAPNQVIKGWTEAMQLMVEGDKWEMYIPSELAYGESGSPPKIKGGDALIFIMELITIKGAGKVPAMRCDISTLSGCSEQEKEFVARVSPWTLDLTAAELKRLNGMSPASMKPVLQVWLSRRKHILQGFVNQKLAAAKSEL